MKFTKSLQKKSIYIQIVNVFFPNVMHNVWRKIFFYFIQYDFGIWSSDKDFVIDGMLTDGQIMTIEIWQFYFPPVFCISPMHIMFIFEVDIAIIIHYNNVKFMRNGKLYLSTNFKYINIIWVLASEKIFHFELILFVDML